LQNWSKTKAITTTYPHILNKRAEKLYTDNSCVNFIKFFNTFKVTHNIYNTATSHV